MTDQNWDSFGYPAEQTRVYADETAPEKTYSRRFAMRVERHRLKLARQALRHPYAAYCQCDACCVLRGAA